MTVRDLTWTTSFLERFDAYIEANGENFRNGDPFPHAAIDGLFDRDVIEAVQSAFPPVDDASWEVSNQEGIQVKLRSNWLNERDVPDAVRPVVHFLNSGEFMKRLSALSGIDHLISDPYYTGGGLNCILPGGLLDVHCDGNWHHAMGVHRRLNVILFLNDDWQEDWNGALELWDRDMTTSLKSIYPNANRLMIFETHDFSYHGHPKPLACPPDRARRSLILYYYTSTPRPADQILESEPHRALWRSTNLKPLS